MVLVGAMGIKPERGEIFDYFRNGKAGGIRRDRAGFSEQPGACLSPHHSRIVLLTIDKRVALCSFMPRMIWSNPGNPTRAVSDTLGIARWQLRNAIHRIKENSGLSGADRVIIWDDGSISDVRGNPLGNVYDEI